MAFSKLNLVHAGGGYSDLTNSFHYILKNNAEDDDVTVKGYFPNTELKQGDYVLVFKIKYADNLIESVEKKEYYLKADLLGELTAVEFVAPEPSLDNYVTKSELSEEIGKCATSEQLTSEIAKCATTEQLTAEVAKCATTNALTTGLAKCADTDLSNITDAGKQVIKDNATAE